MLEPAQGQTGECGGDSQDDDNAQALLHGRDKPGWQQILDEDQPIIYDGDDRQDARQPDAKG